LPNDRILSLLGLAAKAGKAPSGGFAVEESVKSGKACLVVTAQDASAGSAKKFADMCRYYRIPCWSYADKEALGHALGRGERAAAAVTDENLARAIRKLLEERSDASV